MRYSGVLEKHILRECIHGLLACIRIAYIAGGVIV